MRPLLAVLVIAVLALVGWTVYAVLPEGGGGDGGMDLVEDVQTPAVGLSSQRRPDAVTGESGERIQTDRVIEYRLVDAETGEGLAGSGIYKVKTGELILRCDEEGVAQSTEPDPGQLYFYAEGYLLGFFLADRKNLTGLRAQAGEGLVRVPLYRDVVSFPLSLAYFDSDGRGLSEVISQVTLLDGTERLALSKRKLKTLSSETRAAWRLDKEAPGRSANFIRPPVIEPLKKQRLYFDSIRLTTPGSYKFEVTAEGGLLCEKTLWVDVGTRELRLTLNPGLSISGRVVDEINGQPLEAVDVDLEEPDSDKPVRRSTAADGEFSFESLNSTAKRLSFEHELYETQSMEAVLPGSRHVVQMKPLPRRDVRGRVLVRGSELPIEGASIRIGRRMETGGVQMNGSSFILHDLPRKAREMVRVSAEGFIHIQTEIEADCDEIDFLLTPDSPEGRFAAGLTALLRGRVVDANGKPVAGIDVRLRLEPASTALPSGWRQGSSDVHRRFGMFSPPGVATTNAAGEFVLESKLDGLAVVALVDGEGVSATVRIQVGASYDDLLIRIK